MLSWCCRIYRVQTVKTWFNDKIINRVKELYSIWPTYNVSFTVISSLLVWMLGA